MAAAMVVAEASVADPHVPIGPPAGAAPLALVI